MFTKTLAPYSLFRPSLPVIMDTALLGYLIKGHSPLCFLITTYGFSSTNISHYQIPAYFVFTIYSSQNRVDACILLQRFFTQAKRSAATSPTGILKTLLGLQNAVARPLTLTCSLLPKQRRISNTMSTGTPNFKTIIA